MKGSHDNCQGQMLKHQRNENCIVYTGVGCAPAGPAVTGPIFEKITSPDAQYGINFCLTGIADQICSILVIVALPRAARPLLSIL